MWHDTGLCCEDCVRETGGPEGKSDQFNYCKSWKKPLPHNPDWREDIALCNNLKKYRKDNTIELEHKPHGI